MKAVILAGGYGTRISEESAFRPKPMIEIGEMPILWHIIKELSYYGINEFIICAGYKQHMIKEWFANYSLYISDVTFDFSNGSNVIVHNEQKESWKVTIIDTGLDTMTGGRIKKAQKYVGEEPFLMTYGDAVSDINVAELMKYHNAHGCIGTISVYNFKQNKGVLVLGKDGFVKEFREKSDLDGNLINIGYMVFQPEIFDYIEGDNIVFEQEPINQLIAESQLKYYTHRGFWQCMDTMREKEQLEELWENGQAPWKVWED